MSKTISARWIWVAVVVGLLWVSAEVRYWRLRHRLSNLWDVTTAVRAVDESSGAVLPVAIGGIPGIAADRDYLPRVSITAPADQNLTITVVSDEPLTVQISSEGYEEQPLTIDQKTDRSVTVKLRRK